MQFLLHLFQSRKTLLSLIQHDFKKNYLGSYLGIAWAFIQPLAMIAVLYMVFEVGFKATPVVEVPFVLWLMAGMFPWFFFVNALNSATSSLKDNAFLIKKVNFRLSLLPIVPISSALIIHIVFIFILMAIFMLNGIYPTLYWLQLPLYTLMLYFFSLGLAYISASIYLFVKDIQNFIAVFIQIGFWYTPIFWSLSIVPEKYHYFIKINPLFFIVNGYRDSLIHGVWFFEHYKLFIYFSALSILTFMLGVFIFRRLRPHFGDVL